MFGRNLVKSLLNKALRRTLVMLLIAYQVIVSPFFGQRCRFYPSCSNYAIAAVENHGIIRGLFLTIKRLLKCHPWHPGGVDPIPKSKART